MQRRRTFKTTRNYRARAVSQFVGKIDPIRKKAAPVSNPTIAVEKARSSSCKSN